MVPEIDQFDFDSAEESLRKDDRSAGSDFTDMTESSDSDSGEKELTDQELASAFGKRPRRWMIFGGIGLVTVVLSLFIWKWSGRDGETPLGSADSIAVTDSSQEELAAALSDTTPSDSISNEIESDVSEQVAEKTEMTPDEAVNLLDLTSKIDSLKIDATIDEIEIPIVDEFKKNLDASFEGRAAMLTGETEFERFLVTSIVPSRAPVRVPSREIPSTEGDFEVARPVFDERLFEQQMEMSNSILMRLDSLQQYMATLKRHIFKTEDDKARLEKKLDQMEEEADSLKDAEIKKLAKIINSMKPEYSASMLRDKRNSEITEILFKVKPRTAAKVLEHLPANKRSQVAAAIMRR